VKLVSNLRPKCSGVVDGLEGEREGVKKIEGRVGKVNEKRRCMDERFDMNGGRKEGREGGRGRTFW